MEYSVSERTAAILDEIKPLRDIIDRLAEKAVALWEIQKRTDEEFKPILDCSIELEGLIIDMAKESMRDNLITASGII